MQYTVKVLSLGKAFSTNYKSMVSMYLNVNSATTNTTTTTTTTTTTNNNNNN